MSDLPSPFNQPDRSEVYTTPKDVLAYVVREMKFPEQMSMDIPE